MAQEITDGFEHLQNEFSGYFVQILCTAGPGKDDPELTESRPA